MAIPYAPTKITVLTPSQADIDAEPYMEETEESFVLVQSGVRASIGTFSRTVSATSVRAGGEQSRLILQLTCDPIPGHTLSRLDRITDESTGVTYEVNWAFFRHALGIDHWTAEIVLVEGLVTR